MVRVSVAGERHPRVAHRRRQCMTIGPGTSHERDGIGMIEEEGQLHAMHRTQLALPDRRSPRKGIEKYRRCSLRVLPLRDEMRGMPELRGIAGDYGSDVAE